MRSSSNIDGGKLWAAAEAALEECLNARLQKREERKFLEKALVLTQDDYY